MPFATKTLARDAILGLFTTAWVAQPPPVPLLLYDDVKQDTPKDGSPWARIQVKHNTGFQATLSGETGNKRFTHEGLITVQIFTKYGSGLKINDIHSQIAIEVFQGKRTAIEGVHFINVRSEEIGQSGDWYQTNVIAEFNYDTIK